MKINIDNIKKIIEDGKKLGHDIKMNDIAYSILLETISDIKIVYMILFGKVDNDNVINTYDSSKKVKFIKKYISTNFADAPTKGRRSKASKQDGSGSEELTFGENKEQLIKNLAIIQEMKKKGELDAKDFIKLDIEIRSKLVDKFAIQDDQKNQIVHVFAKYNHICEWTKKECFLQTKEYAMEHWGLVEKTENDNTSN